MTRRPVTLAVVVGLLAAALVAGAPAATASTVASCTDSQLQVAPIPVGEKRDDGTPVKATSDRRGKQVPVVLVAGAGENGAFTPPVDLSTTRVAPSGSRSLLGELWNLPGTAVHTFDTSAHADRWVDDEHLGPALADRLACLRDATGEPAVVVTTGTGGLAVRWALAHPARPGGKPVASTVITLGSPDRGGVLGLLSPGGVAAAERAGMASAATVAALVRASAATCAGTGRVADGSWCAQVRTVTSLAGSDLAAALVPGSSALRAMPSWPKGVAVTALSARNTLTVPAHGWFASAAPRAAIAAGDLVDLGVALPDAPKPSVTCASTLALTSSGWTLSSSDAKRSAPVATAGGACLATDLTRNAELVAATRKIVLADLFRRQPLAATDLLSAPVPTLCDFFPPGTLRNGVWQGPNPDPNGYAQPPTLEVSNEVSRQSTVALGDLDGDGTGDAAAVVNCNKGGVGWPDYVVFWASGLRLLGAIQMGTIVGDARHGTVSLAYRDGAVQVESNDAQEFDLGCCVSGRATLTLRWSGRSVTAADVQHGPGDHNITTTGVGPVKIGMSAQELESLGYVKQPTPELGCDRFKGPKDEFSSVVVDPATGRVVKIRVPDDGHVRTYPGGLAYGATMSDVYEVFPASKIENYLDRGMGQGSSGLFVTDDGDVGISFANAMGGSSPPDLLSVDSITVSTKDFFGLSERYCT